MEHTFDPVIPQKVRSEFKSSSPNIKEKDSIVISGIACRFPESDNIEEFWNNLVNNVDMVTEDDRRWEPGLFGLPRKNGKVKNAEHFDAGFFGIPPKQVNKLDPQLRMLLEVTYEAIIDAGLLPQQLKGTNTGVFIGACYSDAQAIFGSNPDKINGYETTGCALSMFANRISYHFDLHGPSLTVDTACSSSLVALDAAVNAITRGECDYAIVGGSNILLRASSTLGFERLNMLSPEGVCKSFDEEANGYVRSEGAGVIVVCRETVAQRNYARILATGVNNDGFSEAGITFPSSISQEQLLESVYGGNDIDPLSISYVEAHGTGTPAGDPQEVNAIDRVFCANNRNTDSPLLLGSVKSNIGHLEGGAGVAGIIKVLLSMQHGIIPANLHFNRPNKSIAAINEHRIQVVSINRSWQGGRAGVNSFGVGGTNAHVVLEGGPVASSKPTAQVQPAQFVPLFARSATGLERLLDRTANTPLTPRAIGHFKRIANADTQLFPHRGGAVVAGGRVVETIQQEITEPENRPVWFVFSGMGSQWQAMASSLMAIPVFADSINRCASVLRDKPIDLVELLTKSDRDLSSDPTLSFVGITAVQIALLELLAAYGITANGWLGHSIGEIAAAYADQCIDIEQAMLIAYYRGQSINQTPNAKGAMAVVSATWEEAQKYQELGISPACHNSKHSVTLSGPVQAVDTLVKELEAKDEFVRVVDSAGIAFHSPLIQPAAEKLRDLISPLIPQPKTRSSQWLSTSHDGASGEEPQYCDVDYFVNNLANPVRFHGVLSTLPSNAIVIEVGPHSLLRAIVRETLPQCLYINTMLKNEDNSQVFMKAIGHGYAAGLDLKWPLQPVEIDAAENFIFPLYCDWEHQDAWEVPREDQAPGGKDGAAAFAYTINIDSEEFAYIKDHALNNKVVMPGMFYVYLAWKSLASLKRKTLEDTNLFARHIAFHRPVILANTNEVVLKVSLLSATGEFQITDGKDLVASGIVQEHDDSDLTVYKPALKHEDSVRLDRDEFYKELRLRGYNYGSQFQGVQSVSLDGSYASLAWNNNWVSFLDSMLQCGVMRAERRTIIPTFIRELRVCPKNVEDCEAIENIAQKSINRSWSPVAIIDGGKFSQTASTQQANQARLLQHRFSPFVQTHCLDMPGEEQAKEYYFTTQNYVVSQALKLINTQMQTREIPAHIQSLYNILRTIDPTEPGPDILEKYSNHPNGVLLRLAMHIFQSDIDILSDVMPAIVSFNEHNELYENDMIAAYFNNEKFLGGLLKTFYENIDGVRPVKICEVGTGTGGMTAHILQTLRSRLDRYVMTDVSAGFFDNLKNKFSKYRAVTDYCVWDIDKPAPQTLQGDCNLIVANNVIHACSDIKATLANIHQALSENGFFLLFESTHAYGTMLGIWGFIKDLWRYSDRETRDQGPLLSHEKWLSVLSDTGFELVSFQDSGYSTTIYLCKKKPLISSSMVIPFSLSSQTIDNITNAVKQCATEPDTRLWLTGNASDAPGLIGMANCARKEPNNACMRTLFVEQSDEPSAANEEEIKRHDLAVNVYKDGQWGNYQFLSLQAGTPQLSANAYVKIGTPGDLSTLQWTSAAPPDKNDILVYAKALSLNFKDLMLASGKLAAEAFAGDINSNIGGEFAGITTDGKRVMGFVQSPLTNLVKVRRGELDQVYEIPDNWSYQQAASVPVAYLTAYYSLIVKADIQPGQRVLIHSGTSSVGQAAIRVALDKGCEVFTTVGSDAKREYIVNTFPQIDVDHIGSSRSIAFESYFMELTDGQGMEVVLNSLAGELLMASLRITARYGVFLEIGKYDMISDSKIGMELLLREITLHGVGVNNLMVDCKPKLETLKTLVLKGISTGVVQPLPVQSFSPDETEAAFRFLSSGKHIGKVVIDLGEDDEPRAKTVLAKSEFWCDSNKSYIITGGLGGFGLELVEWLISRGARYVVLTSRSGIKDNYQKFRIQRWQEKGVTVTISTLNVARETDVKQLLEDTQRQYPVGGIFHLAMVMEDALLVNQHYDKFQKVCAVKLDACQFLDKHSRTTCPTLEHFVVFSSLAGAAGNPGQSSYGYANFGMDRVCEQRHRDGHPALAIQWGSIGDVGFVNENRDKVNIKSLGAAEQSLVSCLQSLNIFLCQKKPVVASYVPYTDIQDDSDGFTANKTVSVDTLAEDINNILGAKPGQRIDEQQSLHSIGMDSLMAVELQVKLQNDYGVQIELDEMRQLTLENIKERYLLSSMELSKDLDREQQDNIAAARVLFEPLHKQDEHTKEILFFTGTALDPKSLLAELDLPEHYQLTLVNYDICDNISQLATQLDSYIRDLHEGVTTLKLVGFSTGALVLLRLAQSVDWSSLSRTILTTSISPARAEQYASLRDLTIDQLNAVSRSEGLNQLSELPWFSGIDRPEFEVIREQFKFMHAEPFHDKQLGCVDEIILPQDDSVCWEIAQAQKHANKVTQPPGKHDLRTLPLREILMEGL